MRREFDPNINFRFTIKHPTAGRTSYRIEKRTIDVNTRKLIKSETLKLATLDSVNENFRIGALDPESALKQVKEIVETLYRESKAIRAVVHNDENQRLLDQYWEAEYAGRDLVDPDTARYELNRAIDAVGSLSLYAASRDELQKAIDAHKFPANKQRRIVAKLTQILKFAKRPDVKLRKSKPEKRRVKYLRESEFKQMLKHIPLETLATLHEVAFYTGGRIGELFAIAPESFNKDTLELRIVSQIDKKNTERDTKNRRDRVALVFPQAVPALMRWFKLKDKIDQETRKHMAEITRAACIKAFGSDTRKQLKFHDLRHCYAVMLRERGLSTEDVADLIGDSLLVCKEHYTGFGSSSGIMDYRRRAIMKRTKRAA